MSSGAATCVRELRKHLDAPEAVLKGELGWMSQVPEAAPLLKWLQDNANESNVLSAEEIERCVSLSRDLAA